jgi:hypothetical protein
MKSTTESKIILAIQVLGPFAAIGLAYLISIS